MNIVFYVELHKFQNMADPVVPAKEEMKRKYKRQARYEREKEKRCLCWVQMAIEADCLHLHRLALRSTARSKVCDYICFTSLSAFIKYSYFYEDSLYDLFPTGYLRF